MVAPSSACGQEFAVYSQYERNMLPVQRQGSRAIRGTVLTENLGLAQIHYSKLLLEA